MHARLTTFRLDPGKRASMEPLAERFAASFKQHKGFRSVIFMMDDERGEYASVALWDSREDAEAAGQVLGPALRTALGEQVREPPVTRLMEVYEPKG